jgi:hypothetical protein
MRRPSIEEFAGLVVWIFVVLVVVAALALSGCASTKAIRQTLEAQAVYDGLATKALTTLKLQNSSLDRRISDLEDSIDRLQFRLADLQDKAKQPNPCLQVPNLQRNGFLVDPMPPLPRLTSSFWLPYPKRSERDTPQ